MSLKIIGGVYGGRVLRSVRGMGTRPLLGQVREALFNILADRIDGAVVWDLFAGSGASGIEALSHGAAAAMFCEKNGRAVDVLKQNLRMLGDEAMARALVLRADAWNPPVVGRDAYGHMAAPHGGAADGAGDGPTAGAGDGPADGEQAAPAPELRPDVVFLDPPYDLVAEDPVKSMARARALLHRTAPQGCVVFHFETGVLDEDDFDADLDVDLREWGRTAIAMLWRKGEAPERLQRRWAKERAGEDA